MKLLAVALLALHAACAHAGDCPHAGEVSQAHLVGTWRATIDGAPVVTIELGRHPQFTESVRGHLERDGQRIELAGDVDDGDFTLEESANGRNISATWLGEVIDASCGLEIRGTWKAEGTNVEHAFVLRKQ